MSTPTPSSIAESPTEPGSGRLMSLDALRGFDMFWIIGADSLVRALDRISGTGFISAIAHQLTHKDWEGFAFYDLIFPLFVFLVGVSLVYSLTRTIEREGRPAAVKRVIRRGVLLFLLGLFYSGGFSTLWPDIRLMGVLNRIGLCYLFAGLLFCFLSTRGLIAACAALLVGYWAMMTFIPVPGLGAGHFEKGANLANYIDLEFLPGKRYDGTWDPEGLLSTLPAIATCLLGVFAGLLLRAEKPEPLKKVKLLIGAGVVAVALGWLWGFQFPVIKKIWTSSYVLVAGGYSAMLLGAFYYVIDVREYRRWCQPFVWIGMNSITVYLANNIIGFRRLAERLAGGDVKRFFDSTVTTGFGDLVVSLTGLGLGILLVWFLYQRRIFIRL